MALAEGWSVGKQLVELGLVPENCSELRITCTTNDVVVLETKSYVTPEWWDKFIAVVAEAQTHNRVLSSHATINVETGEISES